MGELRQFRLGGKEHHFLERFRAALSLPSGGNGMKMKIKGSGILIFGYC
jgi:hypothetical protein